MGPPNQNYIMRGESSQSNSRNGSGVSVIFSIQLSGLPQYLNDLIAKLSLRYTTRFLPLPKFKVRTEIFRNPLFNIL